ncbi:MAG TPA: hypothetical protein VIY48_15700 [Candidatus Paceibacterota bacterium]
MTVPTRAQQVAEIMRFLDSDRNEGRDLKVIATEIVDGYHEFLMAGIKKPATPLRLGMLLKSPLDNKTWRVSYLDDEYEEVWLVAETSSYGYLYEGESEFWGRCEEFRPKKKIDGKMVEMTDEMIEEAWSNPDWSVGDQISQHQREHRFEVIATGPQCVLMRDIKTGVLNVDSNKNLGQYYKRESKLGSDW